MALLIFVWEPGPNDRPPFDQNYREVKKMSTFRDTRHAKVIALLEEELRLPSGFFVHLENEDDWSYIVKLHTLLDAAITHLVKTALNDSRLDDIIYALPLGNSRTGKLVFARALELLPEMDIGFMGFLTILRNRLVHRIDEVDFSIDKYFASLSDDELRNTLLKWGLKLKSGESGSGDEFMTIFRVKPKLFIKMTALYVLSTIMLKKFVHLERAERIPPEELIEMANILKDVHEEKEP